MNKLLFSLIMRHKTVNKIIHFTKCQSPNLSLINVIKLIFLKNNVEIEPESYISIKFNYLPLTGIHKMVSQHDEYDQVIHCFLCV